MNLEETHVKFGWPEPRFVLSPSGGGPAHFAKVAQAKIGAPLSREARGESASGAVEIRTGVLSANPESDRTDAPIAIVCEFNRHVDLPTLIEAQRLAWNFSHSPLLITLEPSRVLVWSCSVPPLSEQTLDNGSPSSEELLERLVSFEIARPDDPLADLESLPEIERNVFLALQWANLVAGRHFRQRPDSFKTSGRLENLLVENLLCARQHLRDILDLPESRCHDLLARVIFVQFLFHRRDSKGIAALNSSRLRDLAKNGTLRKVHSDLSALLSDYEDTYRLFEWLNEKFNGDLFPGKGATPQDRKREWREEKREVRREHLEFLSRFISGQEILASGQRLLWPEYAFDVIPLELVSSIYELFVGPPEKDKAYYTPGRLVDFMLDAVLPWRGKGCNLKVLDPSCGSGIFLVKAFQRLVHRWRAENGRDPKPDDLRSILQEQIFGIDINEEAIRVASFSLYLALCDELDPRYYWSKEQLFPRLRENNLIARDFFKEEAPVRTLTDAETFDLVIGNAPWGKSSAKDSRSGAKSWAKGHGWKVPGSDHGPVFLAKAAKLVKTDGWVSLIQPGGLLLNRMKPAQEFRRKLFTRFSIEEVINLAAVRREIYAKAIGASCIVTFRPRRPEPDADFAYVTPKPQASAEDGIRIIIEPQDIHLVSQREGASDDLVWSALMWGGRRDLELIRRLSGRETIGKLKDSGRLATREGFIRGKGKQVGAPEIVNRRFLHEKDFPASAFVSLKAASLSINKDPMVHRRDREKLRAFDPPQLIFKQSWRAKSGRFEAVLVEPDESGRGALCSDSYVSVRDLGGESDVLAGLWLTLRSSFAPYWFALTGSQFAGFIPKAEERELRLLPSLSVPEKKLSKLSAADEILDAELLDSLSLTPAEKILVEDVHQVVLPDAQRQGGNPPGYQRVKSEQLDEYAQIFLKVLSATYGDDLSLSACIFQSPDDTVLPVQLVGIRLDRKHSGKVQKLRIRSAELLQTLNESHCDVLNRSFDGIGYRRTIEAVSTVPGDSGEMPILFLVKPAQRRFWLRSLAMRDADRLGPLLAEWRAIPK